MQDRLQVLLIGLLILASGMRGLSMQGYKQESHCRDDVYQHFGLLDPREA